MKGTRAAVEWGFKDVKQVCSMLDFPRKMKVREGPVGQLYGMGVLLWNLRYCAYGGATATFFKCQPPTWKGYLGIAPEEGDGVVDGGAAGFGGVIHA